jgi:hypothetical protein
LGWVFSDKKMKIIKNRNDLFDILGENLIIAEIGVFKGDFSKILLEKIKPKELHLIDVFSGKMCSGDKDGNNIVWTNLEDEYTKLQNEYEKIKTVFIHKGFSYDILKQFSDEYFDLIYIDGDHSYEGVKNDLELSYLKIKNNGYICGHDYSKKMFPSVVNAVDEFCRNKNLKIEFLTEDGCPTYVILKN